ncbi:MAG TPA: hypothetical protein VFS00_25505, partial [Polyangiaceae bacterium]|nr:hypothetical protein [Polyangiaceae bacterium]
MHRTAFLFSLRASLLAAVGLAGVACGDDDDNGGQAGAGGGGVAGAAGAGVAGGGPAGGGVGGSVGSGACQSPSPILSEGGAPTGFETCADGAIRRVAVLANDPAFGVKACLGTESTIACRSDAECVEKPHGKCASGEFVDLSGPTTTCQCVYPCASDAECGAGSVCVAGAVMASLGGGGAFCAPAACATGQDCPSGECGLSAFESGCGLDVQLACRSEADACRTDDVCGGQACAVPFVGSPGWQCTGSTCAIGRPLLIAGRPQTARPAERADWAARGSVFGALDGLTGLDGLDGLDAGLRAALAQHWLDVAALEHASVASFARFTLELLALGAPPALVAEAQRAGLDEVAHAEVAYALASAYAGRRFGPGPLDLAGMA